MKKFTQVLVLFSVGASAGQVTNATSSSLANCRTHVRRISRNAQQAAKLILNPQFVAEEPTPGTIVYKPVDGQELLKLVGSALKNLGSSITGVRSGEIEPFRTKSTPPEATTALFVDLSEVKLECDTCNDPIHLTTTLFLEAKSNDINYDSASGALDSNGIAGKQVEILGLRLQFKVHGLSESQRTRLPKWLTAEIESDAKILNDWLAGRYGLNLISSPTKIPRPSDGPVIFEGRIDRNIPVQAMVDLLRRMVAHPHLFPI